MNENQSINQNYLVLAIVAAIFGCCSFFGVGFILGIIAIVFAAQVNGKARMGDYITADKYSDYAKKLSIISIVITMLSMVYAVYQVKSNPEFMERFRVEYQKALEEAQKEQQSVHDSYQRGYEEGQKKAEELLNAKEQN